MRLGNYRVYTQTNLPCENDPSIPNDWLFRLPSQIYDEDKINTQAHVNPEWSQMVWGCIWIGTWSDLVIVSQDEAAARKGFSSKSYVQTLKEAHLPCYRPGTFCPQDNAKIYTAKATLTWSCRHDTQPQPHPPHSPDLNTTEHVWKSMKAML